MIAITLRQSNPKHLALLDKLEDLSLAKKIYFNETLRKPILRDGRTHYIGVPAIETYLEEAGKVAVEA